MHWLPNVIDERTESGITLRLNDTILGVVRPCVKLMMSVEFQDEEMETKPTKASLQRLHEDHLSIYGSSTKEQKMAVGNVLGGVDEILSALLKSNALINDEKLETLHEIISNPQNSFDAQSHKSKIKQNKLMIEDEGKQQILNFDDSDMLLFTVFNQERAIRIKHTLYSSKTNILMGSIFLLLLIVPGLLNLSGIVSLRIWYICWSCSCIPFYFYLFCWILTANKEAMKLICHEFEFWFKCGYLIIYLVTAGWISYLHSLPIYYICSSVSFLALLFTLTMITDALNISQSSKIMLTALALTTFGHSTVLQQQTSLYQYEVYSKADVSIPNYFGNALHVNVIDICWNSVQILAVFSFRQIYSTIWWPKHASLIMKNPLILYEDQKEAKINENVKIWKFTSIGYWCLMLMTLVLSLFSLNGKVLMLLIVSLDVVILVLLTIGSLKVLYAANIFILVVALLRLIGSYFFEWNAGLAALCLLGFGFTAVHTLRVKENELGMAEPNIIEPRERKKENVGDVKLLADRQKELMRQQSTQSIELIETETVKKYDDVDRQ